MKRKKNVKWFKERPKKRKKERLLFYGSAAVPVADNHHLYSSDSLTPLKSQTGVNSVDNSNDAFQRKWFVQKKKTKKKY